ncbi:MAG TPA: 16S rRNA (adenine(1518)-N(6)/adenine(1519)-N(6))-dimethyltransferase RsmA [Candidatus Binatia bacterium]|nr:16S rRNA (adenine(1518)-N(6)/adenine(1519)-N(6))-dimethyltransferase RsmA [Candidatus Binatia bacterium]
MPTFTGQTTVAGKTIMDETPFGKKSLGQHWLNDQTSLEAMCQAARLEANDTVLEIGPGLGSLTKLLCEQAARVLAVELDNQLAISLKDRIRADNLEVINEDILKFDLTKLPPKYKVVANIPYYLTSQLIRVLSESVNPAAVATLLVQKEVAERLAAKPGNLSILGVTAQFYWQVELGPVVKAELFTPQPKVDSQIVVLTWRDKPLFNGVDTKQYFRLVRAGFSQKRKTLLNSLSAGLAITRQEAETKLKAAGIEPSARAQTLSQEDWHKLYLNFYA